MISFFGASVTQQKTGYAKKLEEKFQSPVKIFGFGGMHLKDAGICFIDNVLDVKPDVCFIEWLSTGYNETNSKTEEYLDTIVYRFSKANCKLVFLFLPYKNDPQKEDFHNYCKTYLERNKIAFIDVKEFTANEDIELLLRDDVHTTELGSELYSEIIFKEYSKISNEIELSQHLVKTKYTEIKKVFLDRIFDEKVFLQGQCEIIGFQLTIGAHSGIIEVEQDGKVLTFNTWDRWCHYDRKHFNMPMTINGDAVMKVTQKNFDTTSCTVEKDFSIERKKLIIHYVYYVGETLSIKNKSYGQIIHMRKFIKENIKNFFIKIKRSF
jgi:hypothetical protein